MIIYAIYAHFLARHKALLRDHDFRVPLGASNLDGYVILLQMPVECTPKCDITSRELYFLQIYTVFSF